MVFSFSPEVPNTRDGTGLILLFFLFSFFFFLSRALGTRSLPSTRDSLSFPFPIFALRSLKILIQKGGGKRP